MSQKMERVETVDEEELLLRAQRRASELGTLVTTRKAHHSALASHHEKMVAQFEIASKQLQVMLQKMIHRALGQEELSADYGTSCIKVFDEIETLFHENDSVDEKVDKPSQSVTLTVRQGTLKTKHEMSMHTVDVKLVGDVNRKECVVKKSTAVSPGKWDPKKDLTADVFCSPSIF